METLNAALQYAAMGLRIFPVKHGTKGAPIKEGGKVIGSGQLLKSWKTEATTQENTIKAWWQKWPDADVCIVTGGGLTVVDLDVKHPPASGEDTLIDWQMQNGFFPMTRECRTGSGGKHLYFWTSGTFKSRNGFMPGVDIKSEGGYVVAPPSCNSGGQYTWLNDLPIAPANENVLAFLSGRGLRGKPMKETPEGNRDNTMLAQTYKLAHDFSNREEALQIALAMNQKCSPPLDEAVVKSQLDRAYAKVQKEKKAKVITLSEIKPEKVEWLWYPYIPLGKITIVAGDSGIGKTFFESAIAAIVSTGRPFPGGSEKRAPRIVCVQNSEDGLADTIVKRLMAAGADLNNVMTIDPGDNPLSFADPRIEDFMKEYRPAVMIFDPFQSFFGAGVDLNRSNETRPVFDNLLRLAQKYKVAVILIMHLSKMTKASAKNRVLGSVDVVGAVRSVLIVAKHPTVEGQIVVCHEKSNLAPSGRSLCYHIENSAVKWGDFCELSADDCLLKRQKAKAPKTKLEMAIEFLESRLAVCGKVRVEEMTEIAEKMEISYKTFQRAKEKLGLIDEKEGFAGDVFWKLP